MKASLRPLFLFRETLSPEPHLNAPQDSDDENFDPELEKMLDEENKAQKTNDAAEEKRNAELAAMTDVEKERSRIDSLHSLLDKTSVYSKFVSSQIKAVDANIQGNMQSTAGRESKRKPLEESSGRGKKKKVC